MEEVLKSGGKKEESRFEFAGTGTIIVEERTGTIILAHMEFEKAFGFTRKEIEGKNWANFVAPEELRRLKEYRRLRLENPEAAPHKYEFRMPDRWGKMRTVFAMVSMIPGTELMVASLLDITGFRRMQMALRHREEKFHSLIENALDLITMIGPDGSITYQNPASIRALGYEAGDLIGRDFISLLHPDDHSLLEALFLSPDPASGQTFGFRLRHRDGSWRTLEGIGRCFPGMSGGREAILNSRDITERRQAEEALRRSEERFRLLYDHAPVGYHELDTAGRIVRVNRTELEMLGYRAEEMLGRPLWEFLEEESPETLTAKLNGSRPPYRAFEGTYHKQDGTPLLALIEDRIIRDEAGRITGVLSTLQDITPRKRAEKELADLTEQLRLSQKMEAIGHLAGGIAHDFNNILTVIQGFSQVALGRMAKDDPLRDSLVEVSRAAERAADLVHHLLAFSRRQVLDLRVLDLNALLRELDKMLSRIIGEDINLITRLADPLGRVRADSGQIEQMVLNLAVNARDAMPKGGELILETQNIELDALYARNHIAVKPGRYVLLAISDTGCGMPAEVRERVFEPFFTTKGKGSGTGLGLSTVYGIVKQSGGNIWVYSEPGRGTTFKIYLPQVEEEISPQVCKKKFEIFLGGQETILLVEDEPAVRDLTAQVLRDIGYTVLESPGGEEALRIAQSYGEETIDLLLTDVIMPRMSGRELAEKMKARSPRLKVLFISGYSGGAIAHHGLLKSGAAFLQKPFSIAGLGQKVREVLDG